MARLWEGKLIRRQVIFYSLRDWWLRSLRNLMTKCGWAKKKARQTSPKYKWLNPSPKTNTARQSSNTRTTLSGEKSPKTPNPILNNKSRPNRSPSRAPRCWESWWNGPRSCGLNLRMRIISCRERRGWAWSRARRWVYCCPRLRRCWRIRWGWKDKR